MSDELGSMSKTGGVSPGRRASAVLATAALTAVFAWVWWGTVAHAPIVVVPTARLPANNAYATYLRASSLVEDAAILDSLRTRRRLGNGIIQVVPFSQRRALRDRNQPALDMVREALKMEYVQPPTRTLEHAMPVYGLRHLATLLALDQYVHQELGQWQEAAHSMLDRVAYAENQLRGGSLETVTHAVSGHSIALSGTVDPIEHLNTQQLRQFVDRLQEIIGRRTRFEDILAEEKWYQLSVRDELLSKPNWREGMANFNGAGAPPARFAQLRGQLSWLTVDKRRVLIDYKRYIDACISIARNSRNSVPAYPAPPSDQVNLQLATDPQASHQLYASAASADARILLRALLRLYYLDHGSYPQTLAALSPKYVQVVPEDPLAGAFNYRRTAKSYSLASSAIQFVPPATYYGSFPGGY